MLILKQLKLSAKFDSTNQKIDKMLTEIKNDDMLKKKIHKQKYSDFYKDLDKAKKYLAYNPHYMDLNNCFKLSLHMNNIITVINDDK